MLKSLNLTEKFNQLVEKVSEPIKEVGSRIRPQEEDNLAPQLLAWVENESGERLLAAWLKNLPEEALVALSGGVSAFCSELGFEISWLLEHQLDEEPKLKALISQIVLNYLSACYQAALSWADTHTFRMLGELESHLANDKPFVRELYFMLGQNKLIQPASSNLFLGQEEELHSYMIEEIRQAMHTNKAAFKRVLKELLTNA